MQAWWQQLLTDTVSLLSRYWLQQWYNLLLHVSIICAMPAAHDHDHMIFYELAALNYFYH